MNADPCLGRPPLQARLLLLGQRPLVVYGIVAAACAWLGTTLCVSLPVRASLYFVLVSAALLLLSLAAAATDRERRRGWIAAVVGAAFLLGSGIVCYRIQIYQITMNEETFTGRATAIEDVGQGYSQYTLQGVRLSNGKRLYGKLNIRTETDSRVAPGTFLRVVGSIEPIQGSRFPGGMDWRSWYWAQGVTHSVYSASIEEILRQPEPFSFYGISNGLLRYIRHTLDNTMKDAVPRELSYSLLSGRRDLLSQKVQAEFTLLGILHILAVSGFNVVMTAGTAYALALRCKAKPAVASGISLLVLLFYFVITGLAPSVMRAGIMWIVFLLGGILGRRYDPLAAWAAALILVLAINPLDVGTVGFQLSFLAAAGIILLYSPMHQNLPRNPAGRYLLSSAGVSVCAQAATYPVMLGSFGTTTLFAPLANILFIPPISLALLGILLLLMLARVPALSALLGTVLDLFIAFVVRVSALLAPIAPQIRSGKPDVLIGFSYLSLLLLLSPAVAALGRKSKQVAGVLLLTLTVVMCLAPPLWMAFPQKGILIRETNGMSLLYRQEGKLVLVCSGEAENAAEFLTSAGIFTLDAAAAAGRNPDENLLYSLQGIQVSRIYMPEEWLDAPLERLYRDAEQNRVEILGITDPSSPVRYTIAGQGEESSHALQANLGGTDIVYVPNLSAKSFDELAEGIGECDIAVFGTTSKNVGQYAQQLGAGALVARIDVEDDVIKSYNMNDCGSILLEEAAGGLELSPWRPGGT